MNDDILDDELASKEADNGAFVLTKTSLFNLYEAAKWARILSVITMGYSAIRIFGFLMQAYTLASLNEGIASYFTSSFVTLLVSILSLWVSMLLYNFGDGFIKGYQQDSDDLIDISFIKLNNYFKFSIIISIIGLLTGLVYILVSSENIKYVSTLLIAVIPIGLLGFYIYQNREGLSNKEIEKY